MGFWQYTAMVLGLAGGAASLGAGARRLRSRLAPDLSGATAVLAASILALSALLVLLELLGVVGCLRAWSAVLGSIAVGSAMACLGTAPRAGASRSAAGGGALLGVGIAMLVLAEWAGPTITTLHRGITDGDSLWYHLPFAAGFAQSGSITGLAFTGPDYLSWFYPANSELVHAFGMLLAGGRDVLSPLIPLGWLALCLLAAWCVGRPFRSGPACVAAVALLLGAPLVVARDPGAARSDVAGIAFLLASVAVLVNCPDGGQPGRGAILIAALAAGWAAGAKLTLLPAVVVLSIGIVLTSRGRRRTVAATWSCGVLATGACWYLRNLLYSGNPLPWLRLGIGPLTVASAGYDPAARYRFSILHYAHNPRVWRDYLLPGLHAAFGPLWPLLIGLAAVGLIAALIRGSGIQRVVALAGVVTALAYVTNPMSAPGPDGAPTQFEANLRYLAPALALGLVLLPTVGWPRRALRLLPVALLGAFALDDFRLDGGTHRLSAVATFLLLGGAVGAAAVLRTRGRWRVGVALAAMAVAFAMAIGWPVTQTYLRDRYRGRTSSKLVAPGIDAAYRWARSVSGARIATTSVLGYGLYGETLSNQVRFVGSPGPGGTFRDPSSCRLWRTALDAEGARFVVVAPEYEGHTPAVPFAWARGPRARAILKARATRVYRLDGRLPSSECS